MTNKDKNNKQNGAEVESSLNEDTLDNEVDNNENLATPSYEELFDKKYAIVSPLILSTTYLWFDYSHLATQDMIFSCLVTLGIYSLAKLRE